MTLQEFAPIFVQLAMQLRYTAADEPDIRAYYAALEDLDTTFVAMAATAFARRPSDTAWFPKTPEWRAEVAKVIDARRKLQAEAIRARLLAGQPPLCACCEDTGWQPGPSGVQRCACRRDRWREIQGLLPMPTAPLAITDGRVIPPEAETIALRAAIDAKLGPLPPVRSMPALRPMTREERSQVIDLARQMRESVDRCRELEAGLPPEDAA